MKSIRLKFNPNRVFQGSKFEFGGKYFESDMKEVNYQLCGDYIIIRLGDTFYPFPIWCIEEFEYIY